MGEYAGPVIEIIKVIGGPIIRQFKYLCCFNANIKNMRDEAKTLNDVKVGLKERVDAATRNIQVIVPAVVDWLDDEEKFQADKRGIEAEIGVVGSGCLAMMSRFVLSRKATKLAVDMKLHQDYHAKFREISYPPPPPAVAPIPQRQTYELQSRKHLEDDIMATLREKKVTLMGICGMGGVGKTTMANKIRSRAREEGLFVETLMVVVSQPVDMLRIQREIAESLGLTLTVGSLQARAQLLEARLSDDNKSSKLIVLDDLWEKIDLGDLGIPNSCTILLTSRNRDVFREMGVDKCLEMKILEFEEAWSLFKEKVGASAADDPTLSPLPEQIVRECKGLPIALVTVGGALKDNKCKATWRSADRDLKLGYPHDIPNFLKDVYKPLQLSYDLLQSKNAKSIFLMCCLFPEDRNIPISDLSLYALGLKTFEGITRLHDARDKMQTVVEMLKSRSLLLDGYKDGYVKMHDVVRDVGIYIAGKEGLISSKSDCTWISVFNNAELPPTGSVFPNLRFLLMEGPTFTPIEDLPLSDNFFESAAKLNVLSIRNYKFRPPPEIAQLQKYLRTLILDSCDFMGDISFVGELESLEVLCFRNCESIEELPVEIGRLNQLKLLNVSYCWNLERIAGGVVSKLIRLEELTLIGSFSKWEAVKGGENAALCELNCLSSLTTLRIQIDNASLAAQIIHLSPYLTEFYVEVGREIGRIGDYGGEVRLVLKREVMVGDWIHQLLRTTECLHLTGEGATNLMAAVTNSFVNLQELHLKNLRNVQHLRNDYLLRLKRISVIACSMLEQVMLWDGEQSTQNRPASITFPKLEKLTLCRLPRLTSFSRGIQKIEFPLLTEMKIENCPNMKNLVSPGADEDELLQFFCNSKVTFGRLQKLTIDGRESQVSGLCCDQISRELSSTLVDLTISNCANINSLFSFRVATNFVNLESINTESCSKLKQLASWNEEENSSITFSKLDSLRVNNLPRLTYFCKGIQSIEFPLLTKMRIVDCPNLKSLVSSKENCCSEEDSLHLFCCKPDQAAFGRLKELTINRKAGYDDCSERICVSLLWCHLIPIDFFRGLHKLEIYNCGNIKSLFSPSVARNLISLRELSIDSCGEMVKVIEDEVESSSSSPLVMLKLERLYLRYLPKLTFFFKGIQSIEFPLLTEMKIEICPNLKSLVSSMENGCLEKDSLHLFCKPDQAAFGQLKVLTIGGVDGYDDCSERICVSSLWCHLIPIDFLRGLERLNISDCGNMKSLFSPSIARNLIRLRSLSITNCGEMVKVIEDEVESSSSCPLVMLKLEWLYLTNLPKLKSFCDWGCALHLPSPKKVYIRNCREMETSFSFGSSTTPNLESITKDGETIYSDNMSVS